MKFMHKRITEQLSITNRQLVINNYRIRLTNLLSIVILFVFVLFFITIIFFYRSLINIPQRETSVAYTNALYNNEVSSNIRKLLIEDNEFTEVVVIVNVEDISLHENKTTVQIHVIRDDGNALTNEEVQNIKATVMNIIPTIKDENISIVDSSLKSYT